MKSKFLVYYMKIALETSNLSYCERNKVGCIIVKNNSIISIGYNGTLPGTDNKCEDDNFQTTKYVLHAEENAIHKLCKSTETTIGAIMFVTLQPCINCAKMIINTGIKTVYYNKEYRDSSGIELLKKFNVSVEKISVI